MSTLTPRVADRYDVALGWLSGGVGNQALPYCPLGHGFKDLTRHARRIYVYLPSLLHAGVHVSGGVAQCRVLVVSS